jgi:mRNA interferase MazF
VLLANGNRRRTARLMPSFKQGDVVKVPFPYTDRATRQSRPALVVSLGSIEANHQLLWVVMITSAENRAWPGDVALNDLELAGLPAPSVIRTAKIATIEVSDATRLGKITASLLAKVKSKLGGELGL